jgi:putative transposase
MRFRLVAQLAAEGYEVALVCRVLEVSRSGYYEWRSRPPCERDVVDAQLGDLLRDIHRDSRGSYGAPRAHQELRLALGWKVGRKRVARVMRLHRLRGIGGARKQRRNRPAAAVHDDLVARQFRANEPDRLWCTDITEHPTPEGKVYCCAVLDVFSRVIVGWSIADHMRSELVVDALQMATWRRNPGPGAIVHADRGSQTRFNRSLQHLLGGATVVARPGLRLVSSNRAPFGACC